MGTTLSIRIKIAAVAFVSALALNAFGSSAAPAVISGGADNRLAVVEKVFPRASEDIGRLENNERELVEWLYSAMQTPDITAYPPQFFINNVRMSLKAREEMPWGKSVPEKEFRHFVVPVRVNNENLDNSREVFYAELKERLKGMSMEEALLEVNHWCHEKVTYRPSDGRTSSPLSSVSQAIGRCGEESTFAVAALRSVGIPARQVYTPRWAHTDDNHAWVEAWVDGKWHFLGACEPAPMLDMAWFNAPASRGLLMTTNVAGSYGGPEEILASEPLITTINVTSNYAPTGTIHVRVVDTSGKPVEGAKVNFCIYNYADLYPAARKRSGSDGTASLVAGRGDMVIWATDGRRFGFAKGNPADDRITEVILDKDENYTGGFDLDIVPPRQSASLPLASPGAEALNNRRLAREDSIRNAYTSGFFNEERARSVGRRLGLDEAKTAKVLTEARGNGGMLARVLESSATDRALCLDLLLTVSEKDRRDITAEVIDDNLRFTPRGEGELFRDYVLNPRVENEGLVPYKSFFRKLTSAGDSARFRSDPSLLAEFVASRISIDTVGNPSRLRMDPRAVWLTGMADPRSRGILFVSMARSIGIPARIDPVTAKTQYHTDSEGWIDVRFGGETENASAASLAAAGTARLMFTPEGRLENPKYYSQFGMSRITDGVPVQLEYPENEGFNEMGADSLRLEKGQYLLLSGRRMADGSVLARGEIFRIKENRITDVPLIIRNDSSALSVIGSLNAENLFIDGSTGEQRSILSATGRGYYILGLIKPGDEPTSHILNDISALREELEKQGNRIVMLFADEDELNRFDRSAFPSLPSTVVLGIDKNGAIASELVESLNLENGSRPLVVVADTFNRVVSATQGYTIGSGERLVDMLHRLH